VSRPALLYVGHSYHRQTSSTQFFLDLLRREYEVSVLWDESWLPGNAPLRAEQINSLEPDVVLFFQLVPARRELRKFRCRNLFLVPMHDYVVSVSAEHWSRIGSSGMRVINFCRASQLVFTQLGFESLPVQYWPPASAAAPSGADDELRILFWARRHEIGWQVLKRLLGSRRPERITLRIAPDPGETIDLPDESDVREYRVNTVAGWLEKERYLELLADCNIFMAPRPTEGIGQATLEAMAMGIAVVAPDAPTMNEYIVHNRNGYLYSLDAPHPLEFPALSAIRTQALRDVADGHRQWLADELRILAFMTGKAERRASLRWRLSGWWDRRRS
jgi:glycosyltransferase involved in cell wall biosynthesis